MAYTDFYYSQNYFPKQKRIAPESAYDLQRRNVENSSVWKELKIAEYETLDSTVEVPDKDFLLSTARKGKLENYISKFSPARVAVGTILLLMIVKLIQEQDYMMILPVSLMIFAFFSSKSLGR
jgi:hypothetical protein